MFKNLVTKWNKKNSKFFLCNLYVATSISFSSIISYHFLKDDIKDEYKDLEEIIYKRLYSFNTD